LCIGLFLSPAADASPEFRFARDFPSLQSRTRSSIIAIYNVGSPDKPDFRMARPSILPISNDGKIIWFKGDAWREETLMASDRIILEEDMLGQSTRGSFGFPGCFPRRGEKVSSDRGVAWLTSCPEYVLKTINGNTVRVSYDQPAAEILSRFYRYKFKTANHMLFDEVVLRAPKDIVVARDSRLYIKSDIRNFFTLNFSSSDIESQLMEKRIEPMAAFASLGFYLKVLFFKITLDLSTDVAFFESSANIPMVMTLPVNAYDRLNRKSGVLYDFEVGDAVDSKSMDVHMPILDPDALRGDFATAGLNYCTGNCNYELVIPTGNKQLKMQIRIHKSLVEKGMFPWFVRDVSKVREKMGWSVTESKGRVGLYFEVSGLPKGSHPWDFWISF